MSDRAHASGARTDLFDRARAAMSIETLLERQNVKLVRAGKERRGACVLCDGGGQRFAVKDGKWRCYGCDKRGDVVDLVEALQRCTKMEAVSWLLGGDMRSEPAAPRAARPKPEPTGPSVSDKVAIELWETAKPFEGSLGERYLLGRGIAAEVVALAAANLRYHPFAKHHWDDAARDWVKAPAMVARSVTVAGPTGGVHATYLDRGTAGKAALEPAKRMWGPQRDAEGRPGGAWLIGPEGGGDLVVGEGIETSLSVVTLALRRGVAMRACAALSLNRLQGGWLRDDDGCVDPSSIQPDPASPAFTWPPPADPWASVVVAVDMDMADQKTRVRTGRGKPCDARLPPDARARICGRLAVAAWKAAGAPKARAIAPPPGLDFNDHLRRMLARECVA